MLRDHRDSSRLAFVFGEVCHCPNPVIEMLYQIQPIFTLIGTDKATKVNYNAMMQNSFLN